MNKEALIYYSYIYRGDYHKIVKAIANAEPYHKIDIKNCFTIYDDVYPKEFLELKKPPFVIYYYGNLSLLKKDKVSIVGSRKVSKNGCFTTKKITDYLKQKYVIVSGMAKGVDSIAHVSAIDSGSIAVIGSGIDYIYPKENKALYYSLIKNGLVLSEYPKDVLPYAYHFPFRNRLIVALGKKLVITHSRINSGTFTSVNEALELGRDIYVAPYHFLDDDSDGSNVLIEEGANIITINNLGEI